MRRCGGLGEWRMPLGNARGGRGREGPSYAHGWGLTGSHGHWWRMRGACGYGEGRRRGGGTVDGGGGFGATRRARRGHEVVEAAAQGDGPRGGSRSVPPAPVSLVPASPTRGVGQAGRLGGRGGAMAAGDRLPMQGRAQLGAGRGVGEAAGSRRGDAQLLRAVCGHREKVERQIPTLLPSFLL